jgi:hypothetical protein
MSFNPDDEETQSRERTIQQLREENSDLSRQIAELSARLSRYELHQGAASNAINSSEPTRGPMQNIRGSKNSVGRKSIAFDHRNLRQHQGRMAYLLKKLETKQTWTLDAIADLQAYCVSTNIASAGPEFYNSAVKAYAGEDGHTFIVDLDALIAMIQS